MSPTGPLSISYAGAATGLSTHTLRSYERSGLIDPVGRAESTHRRREHRNAVRAQPEHAARNLFAIDSKVEIFEERITN